MNEQTIEPPSPPSHQNAMNVYREAMLKDLFMLREGDSLVSGKRKTLYCSF